MGFLEKVENLYHLHQRGAIPNSFEEIQTPIDELLSESQVLLKREWKRVKKGEPAFWVTKQVALTLFLVSIVSSVAYIYLETSQ